MGVVTGLVDTLITFVAMIVADSAVLLADFLKTFLELLAVTFSWLAIRKVTGGKSHHFDYGMGKLENLVSLFVCTLMTLCLLLITINAIKNFLDPSHISGPGIWISLSAQVAYSGINTFIGFRSQKAAKAENSPLMASQARLHFTRAIANGFILVSLVSSMALHNYEWALYIDPVASLVIAGSILMAAAGIFSTSVRDLLDRTLEEADQLLILRELTRHFDDYEFLHGIRSRRSGPHVFVEIFLEFDPERKIGEVQTVIDYLSKSIEEKIKGSHVTIGLATGPVSRATPGKLD